MCGHMYVFVCACVCISPPPRLLITSSMMWSQYDWLNEFYSFYMTAIVSIISRRGLKIEAQHRSQPNKSKLALCKPWIHFNSLLKQLYISNKTEHFSYKGGFGVHGCKRIEMVEIRAGLGYIYVNGFGLLVI